MASDGGQYRCSVKNSAGEDSIAVTLNGNICELYNLAKLWVMPYLCYVVSPIVIEHPQAQNVTSLEGTIQLSCTVAGFPSPAITWFHNNTLEGNNLSTTEAVNVYTTRSTFIRSIAVLNDSGAYFCKAVVDGYSDLDSNTVIVLVQSKHQFLYVVHYLHYIPFCGMQITRSTLKT